MKVGRSWLGCAQASGTFYLPEAVILSDVMGRPHCRPSVTGKAPQEDGPWVGGAGEYLTYFQLEEPFLKWQSLLLMISSAEASSISVIWNDFTPGCWTFQCSRQWLLTWMPSRPCQNVTFVPKYSMTKTSYNLAAPFCNSNLKEH